MSKVTGVVIGHGKSPVGKGWGEHIDKCGIVLRMWDCHWQDSPDWGQRYSWGLVEADTFCVQEFWKHNKKTPDAGWVAPQRPEWAGNGVKLPENVRVLDTTKWEVLGAQLGGKGTTGKFRVSRGVSGACWLLEQQYISELILVGFDNVHAKKALTISDGFPDAYVKEESTYPFRDYDKFAQAGSTKYGNHDYEAEGPLMQSIANTNYKRLSFAQDVWT